MNPHLPHLLHLRRVREVWEVRVVFLFRNIYARDRGVFTTRLYFFTRGRDVFTTRLYFFTRGRDVFTRGHESLMATPLFSAKKSAIIW